MKTEKLPTCEHAVPYPSEEGVTGCGEGAIVRVSWDEGKTWLYLCEEHYDAVLEQDEALSE